MTMTRAAAKRLTKTSRSYGWFRPVLTAPEGYRRCPQCRTHIEGSGYGRDEALARQINDAIDVAMIEHLTTECEA